MIEQPIKEEITSIVDSLQIPYNTIYLVGSRIWGYFSETSDYDIIVEIDNLPELEKNQVRVQSSGRVYDIKLKTRENIFFQFMDKYELPKYDLIKDTVVSVNEESIRKWILYRSENRMYKHRRGGVKEWHYDTFSISDKIDLSL